MKPISLSFSPIVRERISMAAADRGVPDEHYLEILVIASLPEVDNELVRLRARVRELERTLASGAAAVWVEG